MIRFVDNHKQWAGVSKSIAKHWLQKIAQNEKKIIKMIVYNIVSDNRLLDINKQFLKGDYFTDIITFDYSKDSILEGEIYLSYEMILFNSEKFHVKHEDEWNRVLAHGLLHLIGYKDKTDEEAALMRSKENFYLNILKDDNGIK